MAKGDSKSKERSPSELLKDAAADLKRRSPGMSLRSVAAKLGISPSYWSKILNGEKTLPRKLLSTVIQILSLDPQQVAQLQRSFLKEIEEETFVPATGLRVAAGTTSPTENYKNLGREVFWILEEWFYIPILNLFTLTSFDKTLPEIARLLGLRTDQVENAVRRFKSHGFLEENENGELERTEMQVRFPTDRSYTHVRSYHDSVLQKAREIINREDAAVQFDQRHISSVCLAGSSAKLKEAQLILEEAVYRAVNLMAEEPESDEIYQVSLQILPLLKKAARRT